MHFNSMPRRAPKMKLGSLQQGPLTCGESDYKQQISFYLGFPDSSVGKESACNAGDPPVQLSIPAVQFP